MPDSHPLPATDTHAHLASSKFSEDLDDVIARAEESGLSKVVAIACDLEDSETNFELAERFAFVAPTAGIHPLYVHEIDTPNWEQALRELAQRPNCAAIGEIGLDYFHPPQDGSSEDQWRSRQKDVFERQLQIARDLDRSVVIHQRNSAADTAAVLRNFPGVKAVLHCFTGSPAEAEKALTDGHYLSFTGILTFPNAAEVREAARVVPLDRVMVETDCPYLAPVPFRGKRCEPFHVIHTTRALADLHDLSGEEVANTTTRNARKFFQL